MRTAGILNSVTLLAAAAGGITFGVIADRLGRKRALMAAVLIYSIFTAACGFAQSAMQLAVFRVLLGIGMGGEWATGAALVSESFPARHRGKALAFVQSAWAIGYGLAALVNMIACRSGAGVACSSSACCRRSSRYGFGGTSRIRRSGRRRRPPSAVGSARCSRRDIAQVTVSIALMNACCLFGWWGMNGWVPAYLELDPEQGGIGLSSSTMSLFVIAMQTGMWFGYVSFGFIADAIGRKRTYVLFLIAAARPAAALRSAPGADGSAPARAVRRVLRRRLLQRLRRGGRGAVSNLSPRDRGRRLLQHRPHRERGGAVRRSARSPTRAGFGVAFSVAGAAFLLAAVMWIWIPETRNRELI